MNNIVFDELTHTYMRSRDGAKVVGVTSVLSAAGIIDNTWAHTDAMTRGSAVHRATELHDHGTLNEATLDPRIVPYLDAWKQFREETGFEPMEIERRIYHDGEFEYAGTLDRVGRFTRPPWTKIANGAIGLIDIKSGKMPKWAGLQTAPYAKAYERQTKTFIGWRACVELASNGAAHFIKHSRDKEQDFQVFMSCRVVYEWRKLNNTL